MLALSYFWNCFPLSSNLLWGEIFSMSTVALSNFVPVWLNNVDVSLYIRFKSLLSCLIVVLIFSNCDIWYSKSPSNATQLTVLNSPWWIAILFAFVSRFWRRLPFLPRNCFDPLVQFSRKHSSTPEQFSWILKRDFLPINPFK